MEAALVKNEKRSRFLTRCEAAAVGDLLDKRTSFVRAKEMIFKAGIWCFCAPLTAIKLCFLTLELLNGEKCEHFSLCS